MSLAGALALVSVLTLAACRGGSGERAPARGSGGSGPSAPGHTPPTAATPADPVQVPDMTGGDNDEAAAEEAAAAHLDAGPADSGAAHATADATGR